MRDTPRPAVLDEGAVSTFKAGMRGKLFRPGEEGYEEARKVWNGMIDRRPALIARCAGVADVIAAVNFAREQRLPIAIRGGSHNVTGNAVCDGGVVIDLSSMKGIRVDPEARTVRAEGGCTWGDVDHATHAFGLAAPGGVISTTGIAGFTLGGGIGHLTRKYGLSCDNLISADVVLADGTFVTASEKKNPDLFWALRGGGGNFGVVTSFEFKLHPVSQVMAGPILWPLEKSREALRLYRDFMDKAPDDFTAFFAFLIVPPGPPFPQELHNKTVCGVVAMYTGPQAKADAVIAPLRKFGPPLVDFFGSLPFPAVQSMFDGLVPAGLQNYWKADFVNELSDEVIEAHVTHGSAVPTFNTAVHIYPVSGAATRVGKSDTAYFHRSAKYVHVLAAIYPNPADTAKNVAWVRDYWSALHPYSSGAAYVNFLMDEGEDRVRATYGGNYDKLVSVKTKYDPTNLFRLNQNIRPKA
ncbi:MAG TPA: FAD-binding oxidoreductase [Thermoanaerobaculaceae bacterium]|nr:FAD-binding oxidoreductase [Thermoanaerobaculaceae bacterium]